MRNIKTLIITFIIFIMFSGCGSEEKKSRSQASLNFINKISINFPGDYIKYYNNNLYLVDQYSKEIVKLNLNGEEVSRYGGEGRGPGEFVTIIDYDIKNDKIIVVDPSNLRITIYDEQSTELDKIYNLQETIIRGTPLSENEILLKTMTEDNLDQIIKIINLETGNFINVEAPSKLYEDGGYMSDGLFTVNLKNEYFHIYVWQGLFFQFDKNGKVVNKSATIGGKISPPATLGDGVNKSLNPINDLVNFDGFSDNEYIYIHSNERVKGEGDDYFKKNNIIDVYSIDGLRYIKSYYVEKTEDIRFSSYAKSNSNFYFLAGEEIFCYSEP